MTGNVYRLITERHDAKNRSRSAPNKAGEYLEELFRLFDFVYAFRTGASLTRPAFCASACRAYFTNTGSALSTAPG